ncbi:TlpA family protein disulfide reductase [Thalassoroseus pseudoceratinae]|uniref:TlpA family protein disulfide reductase n=1 Tax=Thalassoroseus pseudoceratinae TaxID=2713176 RepID=UPI001424042A|nr:TlpA disulfide reductase family protein [Thalassoroseus pseudoceratinae]
MHGRRTICSLLAGWILLASLSSSAFSADNETVTVKVVTPKEFKMELVKHKGKVILIDYWATWCIPCLKGFPKTVEWHEKYKAHDLVVFSVSMDEPDQETQEQALKFLKSRKATFTNLMSSLGSDEDGMKQFGVPDGALPHYKILNRKLQVVAQFSDEDGNGISHEAVESAIRKELQKR